jgi:hypothetical protein
MWIPVRERNSKGSFNLVAFLANKDVCCEKDLEKGLLVISFLSLFFDKKREREFDRQDFQGFGWWWWWWDFSWRKVVILSLSVIWFGKHQQSVAHFVWGGLICCGDFVDTALCEKKER